MHGVCVCACGVSVCGCGVSVCVCVPMARHKSNTNFNVVTGSTVLPTYVLHASTSVNVSLGQRLILSLPSPFARPSTRSLHISQVCSYVVHRQQSKAS